VRVPAISQADSLTPAILQLPQNGQALAQHGDRSAGLAVVAMQDGELPQPACLPPAITQPADYLQPLGDQRERLAGEVLVAEDQRVPDRRPGLFQPVTKLLVNSDALPECGAGFVPPGQPTVSVGQAVQRRGD
jgi:hypothetical protein